jgi:hypothetical protein
MKLNRYLPFTCVYFFVNSLALPFGLTYTALLAPLFYVWILLTRKKEILLPFIALLLPFIIAHISSGVETGSYTISLLNLLLVYIFCQAVYTFLKQCKEPELIFRKILILNFIFCVIALPLYFTPYFGLVWDQQTLPGGIGSLKRLRLFTYEPSYYALIFTPLFFFFSLQFFFRQNRIHGGLLLVMLLLPYLLAFSIGVIGAALAAGIITWLIYFGRLTSKRRILNGLVYSGAIVMSALVMMVLFFRHNPLFLRLGNIFSGKDTSGKGRTTDAFMLAEKILNERNEYWGIGLGQIKIAGENIIRNYYIYYRDITVRIPNAMAETLVIFGWTGFYLRLFVEIFFFFYTKVWTNYYRLLLFLFMFIYQFTGSFITNVTEYVIWILAFTNTFPQFNVKAEKNKDITLLPQQAA